MSQDHNTTLTLTVPGSSARAVILPPALEHELKTTDKGRRRSVASRLGAFGDWLDMTGREWTAPDLAEYRDWLLSAQRQRKASAPDGSPAWKPAPPMTPGAVNAHLSTIRSRYADLLEEKRHELMRAAAAQCEHYGWEVNAANVKAARDLVAEEIQAAINPARTSAKVRKIQDRAAGDFIRLTKRQANTLIAAPGIDTLPALRDTALIALALATGARAAELCALEVGDHKARTESGAPALLIRCGKGSKQRLVPYGAHEFAIALVDAWLQHAGITSGPIFRGFYRGGRKIRQTALTVVAVEQILKQYPIMINGELRTLKPHDLRRSYAKLLWEQGVKPVAIQQNLGHESIETTLAYIGQVDDTDRQPPAFLHFNLADLPQTLL